MRPIVLLLMLLLFSVSKGFGQEKHFSDLDEALKQPLQVEGLYLGNQTKYSNAKELPRELANCKNLHKISIGWHKNLDISKLFQLLGKLPKLDTLEMMACDLKKIPKEIALLKELKYLKLELNYLTEISPEIGQLQKLEHLNLTSNKLTQLPPETGLLKQLKELLLNSNDLTQLPASICDLKQLQKLNIQSNNLEQLPDKIGDLAQLRVLSLSGNAFKSFPESLSKLNLEAFHFGGYHSVFPYPAFRISTLKTLGLYETVLDSFPESVGKLQNLTKLYLRDLNSFNWSDGLEKLSHLDRLEDLTIAFERYGDIPKEISLLTQVRKLTLIGSRNSVEIMKQVCKLSNLTHLTFDYYNDTILTPDIGNLNKLQFLELGKSKLQSLPKEIGQLKELKKMSLSTNWGQAIEIPSEIGNLHQLEEIDWSWCRIKTLPGSIGNLGELRKLSLWGSNLTEVPVEIGQLKKLEELYLSGNNIKTLPPAFYQLTSLKILNLENNELEQVDAAIGNLISLESVDLSSNKMLTAIPETLGTLPNLEDVFLENTQIRVIPGSFKANPAIKRIKLCSTLIDNPKKMEREFSGKLEWEWNCRTLERMLVNFEEKYGKETCKFVDKKDTLVLSYYYFYNEPRVIDEEYHKTITIAIPKYLLEGQKSFQLPFSKLKVEASYNSIWSFDRAYQPLNGSIEILNYSKNKITLALDLNGKFYEKDEPRKILNKTIVYQKN
ncbi:leucine-rich repeat domain-containing protein [Fluviicola sp.]|uniref:leucine-rich repeat domain-containing protein n=1 Tax=Fluviicola sp. TaxID=1917219 RepID=UPI0026378E85|nr:leucine-rich repeat domain-containing protein [Fluviicola sp.]